MVATTLSQNKGIDGKHYRWSGGRKMIYEKPELIAVLFKKKDVVTVSVLEETDTPGGGNKDPDENIDFGFN